MSAPRETRLANADTPARGLASELGLTVLLFGLTYNLVFLALPALSSLRLSLILICILYPRLSIAAWSEFARSHTILVVIALSAVCYSSVLSATSGDWGQTSRLLHFTAAALFGSAVWVALERGGAPAFAKRFALVATAQSVFVFVSLFSGTYRIWLSGVLVRGGNIPLESAIRPAGFTNSGGALLSVIQALGIFAALEAATTATGRRQLAWHLAAFACLCSTFISGRTGLIMGLAFISVFLLTADRGRVSLIWTIVIVSVVAWLLAPTILGLLRSRIPEFDFFSQWATEIFLRGRETGSWTDLKHMPIPPLTSDTFAGTGRLDAMGANASGSDSGFVQTYFALGLPMTVLVYAGFFGSAAVLTASSKSPVRYSVLFLAMLIAEIKEPFLFKYTLPFFFLTAATLSLSPRWSVAGGTRPLFSARRGSSRLSPLASLQE